MEALERRRKNKKDQPKKKPAESKYILDVMIHKIIILIKKDNVVF